MNIIIKKLKTSGFFLVFGSNVLNKIISFSSGIILVRLLSKSEYGLYSYALNIMSMFLLVNGMGTNTGMMQFGSENFKDKPEVGDAYFRFGTWIGIVFNIILTVAIVLYSFLFEPSIKNANVLLLLMSGIPMAAFILESIQIYHRANANNKAFAILNTTNTILVFSFTILGAYILKVYGIVCFNYFAYSITILMGLKLSKVISKLKNSKYNLKKIEKTRFLKFSLIATFNNGISQLLYIIDVFLIGVFIGDTNLIATYKTATLIPFALNFIPYSIAVYIYPYFASRNQDKKWIRKNYCDILKYLGLFNVVVSGFLFICAPFIIYTIFGEQYSDSLLAFRLLAIGYFFSGTFRIITGNIIVMIRKVNFNFYLSLVMGGINIILDIYMIKNYGITGAAVATLTVIILNSAISTIYLLNWTRSK
ncbi:oligosaccharide flippase family protein [Paenibacillus sp. FSL R7-0345]|uniref:oligosaccharide flippase family protein n=1 Tax=Paenibacillus sp. FSL R7-0345 TaxID=2954535 RepID=UPI003159D173